MLPPADPNTISARTEVIVDHETLDAYPIVSTMPVAWGDMDAFGHVNNVVYLRWFELARIAYFSKIGWMEPEVAAQCVPILARTQAVFRRAVVYPDTVSIGARTRSLGADRFTMDYLVVSESQGATVAFGDARVLCVRPHGGDKVALPTAIAERIMKLDPNVVREATP